MTPDPEQRLPRELLKELIEEGSDAFRGVLEKLLNTAMQMEREEFLGARRWERRRAASRPRQRVQGQDAVNSSGTASNPDSTSTSPGLLSPIPGARVPLGESPEAGHRRDVRDGRVDAQGH